MESATTSNSKNRRTVLALAAVVLGMFAFGFVIAPLYKLICGIAGIQAVEIPVKQSAVKAAIAGVDNRQVTVKFDTTVNADLPWRFRPLERSVSVQPGSVNQARFMAENLTEVAITGRAIPSITPWQAAGYFSKTECFCFRQQVLAARETRVMTVRFMVSPDLPSEISTLTLSYTFMNHDPEAAKRKRKNTRHPQSDAVDPNKI